MKFFLTSGTFIRGTPVQAGNVVDVTESEANILRECKRGEAYNPSKHTPVKQGASDTKSGAGK